MKRVFMAVALLLSVPTEPGWAICSGGPPRVPGYPREPRDPGYPVGPPDSVPLPVDPKQRYLVGDYDRWWGIIRDEILLTLKKSPEDALEHYEEKAVSPDAVPALLSLVGYEGDFCAIVKEVGLRRLRRIPKVDEALGAILTDGRALAPQRAWAAYALGDLRCRRAIPALIDSLKQPDETLRAFSALALGRMGDPEAFLAILPLARNRSEAGSVRCLAILSLALSEEPPVRGALSSLAQDADEPPIRRSAILALGVRAVGAERETLSRLCASGEAEIRAAAVLALALSGASPQIPSKLLKEDPEAMVRGYAALGLGLTGGTESIAPLTQALEKDRDFSVRGCAALALGRTRDPRAVEPLSKACASRSYAFVSDYAAIGLGLSGQAAALPALSEGLGSKQFDRITSSAAGLALLGCPEGAEAVLKALENRNHPIVREYAVVALAHFRKPGSLPKLLECLEDKIFEVRHAAALALAVYGDPAACPALEKALKDKHETVRTCAALAFDLLTADERRPLTLGDQFKADPRNQNSRRAGPWEINRLFNRYLPADYKLPITP